MEKQYLAIMEQSLEKKVLILDQIIEKNAEQNEMLKQEDMSWEDFDENANQKMDLIGEIEKLDEGFEELFQRVRQELETEGGKERYADAIRRMQNLITQITEKSASVQAQEARNKTLVEKYFQQAREKIRGGRTSSKVAMDYYKNASWTTVSQPHFLDSKK